MAVGKDIQLGTLKPAYLAKAAQLDSSSLLHNYMGNKAKSQARNPATPKSRKSEFISSAKAHAEQGVKNLKSSMAIRADKSGTMPSSRSANFAENATMN